jgi:capsular polysaccharide biosynthesis protein
VRGVGNEAELLQAIRGALKPGYSLVSLIDPRSWASVSDVAGRASVMIGPHGGALANAVLMQPGPQRHVIEFAKAGIPRVRQCFCGLTNALNMTFWRANVPRFSYHARDLAVPVDEVVGMLRDIGVAQ